MHGSSLQHSKSTMPTHNIVQMFPRFFLKKCIPQKVSITVFLHCYFSQETMITDCFCALHPLPWQQHIEITPMRRGECIFIPQLSWLPSMAICYSKELDIYNYYIHSSRCKFNKDVLLRILVLKTASHLLLSCTRYPK